MAFSPGVNTGQPFSDRHYYVPEQGKVWTDTARTTPATPGDPVGSVEDQAGRHYATQGTTANKPTLKEDVNGNRYLEFGANEDFLEVDITTTNATKASTIPGVGAFTAEVAPGNKGRTKARIQSTTAAAVVRPGTVATDKREAWAAVLDQRGKNVADNVTSFEEYFREEPLTHYDAHAQDTSSVTSMGVMFYNTSVSDLSPLSGWDTSSVTNMAFMFYNTSVSDLSPLSGWDTSQVTDMRYMFRNTSVSDPSTISGWDVGAVTDFASFLKGAPLDSVLTGDMLAGWVDGTPNLASQLQSGVTLGIQQADYSNMTAAGQTAVDDLCCSTSGCTSNGNTGPNWTINGVNMPTNC